MRIAVTKKHFDASIDLSGRIMRCKVCPVALALQGAGFVDAEVYTRAIKLPDVGNVVMGDGLIIMVARLDDSQYVQTPFEIDLDLENKVCEVVDA